MRVPAFVCCLSIVLMACGEPRSADADRFTFAPVPYTVVPQYWCEEDTDDCDWSWSIDEYDCGKYTADEVVASVPVDQAADFEQAVERWGFRVFERTDFEALNSVRYTVKVPVGSVHDAVRFVNERFVGAPARRHSWGYLDVPPPAVQECLDLNPDARERH